MPLELEFIALALAVAVAGTILARSADAIAEITQAGRMIVGSLLLAAATSLPELTVDISAVNAGMPDLAAGDLFGSSLMNLLILAGLDLASPAHRRMFSREAAAHALPGTLGIVLTAIAGVAILASGSLPPLAWLGIGGWSWSILVAYLLGARMLFVDQRIAVHAGAGPVPAAGRHHGRLFAPAVIFAGAATALFLTGPRLATVAGALADRSGWGGTFVGTTLVAVTTSLPELVSSLAAVRMGAIDLAIGNIFGSNAFNMTLFVALDAAHDGPFFAALSPAHAVTALAIIAATGIGVLGQLYQQKRRIPFVEPDALLIIAVVLGSLALVFRLSAGQPHG